MKRLFENELVQCAGCVVAMGLITYLAIHGLTWVLF